jgi:hypothetical protein
MVHVAHYGRIVLLSPQQCWMLPTPPQQPSLFVLLLTPCVPTVHALPVSGHVLLFLLVLKPSRSVVGMEHAPTPLAQVK